MERERLALEAGAEVARQLTAFSLVTFAMIVGIVIGRIIGQDKRGAANRIAIKQG